LQAANTVGAFDVFHELCEASSQAATHPAFRLRPDGHTFGALLHACASAGRLCLTSLPANHRQPVLLETPFRLSSSFFSEVFELSSSLRYAAILRPFGKKVPFLQGRVYEVRPYTGPFARLNWAG
jgi:hypothetical protein